MPPSKRAPSPRITPGERARRRLEVFYDVTRRLAAVHETDEVVSLIVQDYGSWTTQAKRAAATRTPPFV